jgi:hypothetical protein
LAALAGIVTLMGLLGKVAFTAAKLGMAVGAPALRLYWLGVPDEAV